MKNNLIAMLIKIYLQFYAVNLSFVLCAWVPT